MNEMDLAKAIFGKDDKTSPNTPSVQFGTAVSNSVDGTVSVIVDGETVNQVYEDDDGNPVEDAHVDLPCEPNVQSGDVVRITTVNGAPTVSGVVGGGDRTYDVAASAADAAASAQVSADAAQNSANAAAAAAGAAQTSADDAATAAASAQADATAAGTAAAQAISDAATAQGAADAAQADATAAGTAADAAQSSADAAQQSATNANEYASRALGNLSTVQSVSETLAWVSEHGTMTHTTDTAPDPTHVYFVADPDGDYTVGGATYSLVAEPDAADLGSYYELSIDESLNNYVGTHLALTDDGLWLLPAATGTYKVLVSTGAGSTYTTPGTYIIDGTGGTIAAFKGDGISFDSGTAFTIGDESAYIHFDGDGHINIGGTGITIGGNVSLADLLHKYDATITADDISVTKTGTTATITVGSETVTVSDGAKGDKGDTGATGAQGVSVSSVVHQYYLSTSSSSQAGGSWTVTPADYVTGRYYWERWLITFSDGSTAYTEATLAKEVTSAWTAIESNSEQIALRATKTEVEQAVDAIEVGGRNILLGTSSEWSDWQTPTYNVNNRTKYWYISKNDELCTWATAGQEVTFSMEVEFSDVTASSSGAFRIYSQDAWKSASGAASGGASNVDWNVGAAASAMNLTSAPSDGVYTYTKTVTLAAAHTSRYALQFSIRCDYWASGKYRIRKVKYELGNKPTDWTPAPEDMASGSDLTAAISQEVTNRNSAIEQSAESITSTVSATYATKTEVGQKADNSTVTALSTRVTQTEADVTTAINGVNGLNALVRQYGQGVLVCRTGNTIGALVNADGSFDIVSVTWDGDTPTAGATVGQVSGSRATFLSGNANIVAHPNGGIELYGGMSSNSLIIADGWEDGAGTKYSGLTFSQLIAWGYNEEIESTSALKLIRAANRNRTVLYNNATGTTGTVTLSATAANYNHMRIYFRTSWGGRASVDVYDPNGKSVALNISEIHDWQTASVMYVTRVCAISGKNITRTYEYGLSRSFTSGAMQGHSDSNYIYIIRVEGWNE